MNLKELKLNNYKDAGYDWETSSATFQHKYIENKFLMISPYEKITIISTFEKDKRIGEWVLELGLNDKNYFTKLQKKLENY